MADTKADADSKIDQFTIAGNFNALFVSSCDISFSRDKGTIVLTSDNDVNVELDGTELRVKAKTSGSYQSVVKSGNKTIVKGKIGKVTGGIGVTACGNITVNGKKVTISKPHYAVEQEDEDDGGKYSKKWIIKGSPKISQVKAKSSDIKFECKKMFNSKVSFVIKGSSNVKFPSNEKFNSIELRVNENSEVDCSECIAKSLDVSVEDNAEVKNFLVISEAIFKVLDSGDITGKAARECEITKKVKDAGDLTIKRISIDDLD
jgi:hypothetical protein